MNLANKLTILRILLIPIFVIFIAVRDIPYGSAIATLIFIIASITDSLDGYIARSRNMVTSFGKFMDPLADKLLVTAALMALVELKVISVWIVLVILTREFAITGFRSVAAASGNVIAASKWGKLKTIIQIVAIVFALITVSLGDSYNIPKVIVIVRDILMWLVVLITIASGVDYILKNKSVIKER